eukprot:Pgem_evm1s15999
MDIKGTKTPMIDKPNIDRQLPVCDQSPEFTKCEKKIKIKKLPVPYTVFRAQNNEDALYSTPAFTAEVIKVNDFKAIEKEESFVDFNEVTESLEKKHNKSSNKNSTDFCDFKEYDDDYDNLTEELFLLREQPQPTDT